MILVDAHEDLAYNMLTFGRDYTLSAEETRLRERGSEVPLHNGDTLLGWTEYQRGQVGVVFSTLFAAPARRKQGPWEILTYATPEQAHRLYRNQMDAYHRLVDDHPDKFRLIQSIKDLDEVLADWEREDEPDESGVKPGHPVGLVPLMEGAEGVRQPAELEEWWQRGLRLIGPSWAGTRFAGGTHEPGPLTKEGFALLETMADFNFGLDLSHMDEKAALRALDAYPGVIFASHSNAAALLNGAETNRHITSQMISGLIERDGVIGVVPYNRFLMVGWSQDDGRSEVSLQRVVAHIDYICQMAGDARHVGLGSDFDGGFGWQSVPVEVDTIADLRKIVPLLAEKGYTEEDIAAILGENWLTLLRRVLPEGV
ncbi:MAG: peptidase M19 [Chloroflexota bacterium]|nr:MAG: peptidase M19 [Chloroflexota bacterium]